MKELLSKNLRFLRKECGKSQTDIGIKLNKAHTSIGNWEKGISEPSLAEIEKIARFFEISPADLLFFDFEKGQDSKKNKSQKILRKGQDYGQDEGQYATSNTPKIIGMPKVITVDNQGEENIVHVPVKARAGYLAGYGDPQFIETLPAYQLPGLRHGTFRSFEVSGPSMGPKLLDRDWAIGEWVEKLEHIRENRVHVIVTKNDGILIKRVLNRLKERDKLYLKSDTIVHRSEFPTIELDPADISEIWYARIKISPDFTSPEDIYTRINDLEISVMELQKQNSLKRKK